MKYEVLTLQNAQIIGMAKDILFNKAPEECPKFWGEYVETVIKPVFVEKKVPTPFQQAAIDNGIGDYALCTCNLPNHNCATCAEVNFGSDCTKSFTYVIGGLYKGGSVPEGMQLFPLHSGKWLKVWFEGGMKAFQQQFKQFHKEWLPAHSEFKWLPNSSCLEWYEGADINSPDYKCGVMLPIE